ncbi:hypothetical protein Leryth_024936 [Lithospermum erythrorhizon]|nr:hypothetical protein Leryth_024936 [Lithospermum erythrorhizon]
MANLHKDDPLHLNKEEEEKEFDLGSEEPESPFPLRVLCMLGDITVGQAHRFTHWLKVVRKRRHHRSSGFPHRSNRFDDIPLSAEESSTNLKDTPALGHSVEVSLFQRFGNAAMLDIESTSFSWNMLSSLHHTEHGSSMDQTEEEMSKALEVTVNSGGVVFFALFNQPGYDESTPKEAAAVIKFSSTRMATQSERLGYEFAKWLGVRIPQVRIIHNNSSEWQQIREAAERAKNVAISEGDEVGEMTCSELLEALELSRCLLLMNYVHGSPLLESTYAFDSQESAGRTAQALGRVMMLDLVIRNEDRLPCRRLRWRGNAANLMFTEKMENEYVDSLQVAFDTAIKKHRLGVILPRHKDRRSTSVDSKLRSQSSHGSGLLPQSSDLSDIVESPNNSSIKTQASVDTTSSDFHIVAIDSLVPRRPPAGKRANDQENYPKLVELLINSFEYASHVLHEITGAKLGYPAEDSNILPEEQQYEMTSVVKNFRSGFRAALRDLQGFHIFLLTLHQKLEGLLRLFDNIIINKTSCLDSDREDLVVPEPLSQSGGASIHNHSPPSKEHGGYDSNADFNDSELHKAVTKSSSFTSKDLSDSGSPVSRDSLPGKFCKWSTEQQRSMRLTSKLRDFHKYAKGDLELSKELEQWNEMLRTDAVKLCRDNNFTTGFFEGSDSNFVVDAYELKIQARAYSR